MKIETKHIVWGIVLAFVLFFFGSLISAQNRAVGYEQNIQESLSGIDVQRNRQKSIVLQLVQVVEQSSNYELETLTEITKLRSAASQGDVEQAQLALKVISENYPTLQANQTYLQLMTEMSISENLVTQYRNTYNSDVKTYTRFVRRFPAKMFLSLSGYDIVDYSYLEFDNVDLPDQLFGN